ncbi:MAG: Mur ligase family protein [Pseudomonadota bacterium]
MIKKSIPSSTESVVLSDFYNKRYKNNAYSLENISAHESHAIKLLLNSILVDKIVHSSKNKVITLIDFGCGNGRLFSLYENIALEFIQQQYRLRIIAIDSAKEALVQYQDKCIQSGYKITKNVDNSLIPESYIDQLPPVENNLIDCFFMTCELNGLDTFIANHQSIDCIVSTGVIPHILGSENRKNMLKTFRKVTLNLFLSQPTKDDFASSQKTYAARRKKRARLIKKLLNPNIKQHESKKFKQELQIVNSKLGAALGDGEIYYHAGWVRNLSEKLPEFKDTKIPYFGSSKEKAKKAVQNAGFKHVRTRQGNFGKHKNWLITLASKSLRISTLIDEHFFDKVKPFVRDPMWSENPPLLWTPEEIAKATNGRWITGENNNWHATGVCYYRNQLRKGDLAITTNPDQWSKSYRNTYEGISELFDRGAVAAIVHQIPETYSNNQPLLLVKDTRQALNDLGHYARARFNGKVICVTGSVGKTSTKEAIRYLLSHQGETVGSRKNFNHSSGIALSIAQTPPGYKYGVYEFSVDVPKATLPKAKIIQPNIAVVTDIQPDHLLFYKNMDKLAEQKSLLFDTLKPDGSIILNHDSTYFKFLLKQAQQRGIFSIISYGEHQDSNICLQSYTLNATGSLVEVIIDKQKFSYNLHSPGRHIIQNSLAALAVIKAVGENLEIAVKNLATLPGIPGRTDIKKIKIKDGFFTLIDDTFNANSASMIAGFDLTSILKKDLGGKSIIVVGQIHELGPLSPQIHHSLAAPLINLKHDLVFSLGENMQAMFNELPTEMRAKHAATAADIIDELLQQVNAGDVVYVKGSCREGENMGLIIKSLKNMKSKTN